MEWPRRSDVFLAAKKYDVRKARPPFFIEEKFDGHRIAIVRNEEGEVLAYTRTPGIELVRDKNLPLPPWAGKMPRRTVVECEMIWPGKPASKVPAAIKEHPHELSFMPFAIPFYSGENHTRTRYDAMHNMLKKVTGLAPRYDFTKHWPDIEAYIEYAKERNVEGFILKEAGYHGWWKIKVFWELDLRLVGYKEGQGKYEGEVGAMELEDADGVRIFCSGMEDHVRFDLTDKDIGRLVEVRHNGVTSGGKLRHPRFRRWRDDKEEVNTIE